MLTFITSSREPRSSRPSASRPTRGWPCRGPPVAVESAEWALDAVPWAEDMLAEPIEHTWVYEDVALEPEATDQDGRVWSLSWPERHQARR